MGALLVWQAREGVICQHWLVQQWCMAGWQKPDLQDCSAAHRPRLLVVVIHEIRNAAGSSMVGGQAVAGCHVAASCSEQSMPLGASLVPLSRLVANELFLCVT